jgi:hypothetical protein
MDAQQQAALEGLIGRSLTADEVTGIVPHLAARNDVKIAAILSAGRIKLKPRTITERGVRNCGLGITQTSRFLRMLRELKASTPDWLGPLLTSVGVPDDQHADYADTLASAYDWLCQEAGIDIGTETARQMLDLLAHAPGDHTQIVGTIKALAEELDPINYNAVSDALNIAEGRMTL